MWDVVRSARLIREFTKDKTFSDYEADISDIRQIIAFRNLLREAESLLASEGA